MHMLSTGVPRRRMREQAHFAHRPAIISQLLRGFDLRNLFDTLRISSSGHAWRQSAPQSIPLRWASMVSSGSQIGDTAFDLTSRDPK